MEFISICDRTRDAQAIILEMSETSMIVQFEDHAESAVICFDDEKWMDFFFPVQHEAGSEKTRNDSSRTRISFMRIFDEVTMETFSLAHRKAGSKHGVNQVAAEICNQCSEEFE